MATHRSPNCPQITFEDAIAKGRRVYDKEHTHGAPKAAVAEDLGYSGINGRALSVIGALRQYGILEGNSEALNITEDAVTYFELADGPERIEAMHRMIFAPNLFDSLRMQFGESLPSENTLRFHLIKLGFLPKAADEVISVYQKNIELVKSMPKRYTEEVPTPLEEEPKNMSIQHFVPNSSIQAVPAFSGGSLSFSFPLSMETKADLHIRGAVTVDELEMLRDQIELTIKALRRSQVSAKSLPELSSEDRQ